MTPHRRVLVFMISPVFPASVHGGSQKTLVALLDHLAGRDVEVTVLCNWRRDNRERFRLHPNVTVRPDLRFKETYPEAYRTAPYRLARTVEVLQRAVAEHDVLYVHDSQLHFDALAAGVPTVWAVQDLVYAESLTGAFGFARDRMVAISEYQARCLRQLFDRFRPIPSDRLRVAPNGFAAEEFGPRPAGPARRALGLAEDDLAVLCPHRPDPAKGHLDCLEVLARVRGLLPADLFRRVRLLVPVWQDSGLGIESAHAYQTLYDALRRRAEELDVAAHLVLHPWIGLGDLAEYYACGAATLCIGDFVEAFGNVHVESELCGTPAIVSRVGAHRSVLPDELTRKVDPADVDGAAAHLAEILRCGARSDPAVREHVAARYSRTRMVEAYADAILTCPLTEPLPARPRPAALHPDDRLEVPAWCASLARGYYNDYAGYAADPALLRLVPELAAGTPAGELLGSGAATREQVERWIETGFAHPARAGV